MAVVGKRSHVGRGAASSNRPALAPCGSYTAAFSLLDGVHAGVVARAHATIPMCVAPSVGQ